MALPLQTCTAPGPGHGHLQNVLLAGPRVEGSNQTVTKTLLSLHTPDSFDRLARCGVSRGFAWFVCFGFLARDPGFDGHRVGG